MRQAPKGNWPRQPVTIRRLPTLFGEKGNLLREINLYTSAYVVSAWLVCIALNLLTSGKYLDVAARDVAMAAGAVVLARLSEARQSAASPAISSAPLRTAHAG